MKRPRRMKFARKYSVLEKRSLKTPISVLLTQSLCEDAGPSQPDAERFAQDDSCDELTICTTTTPCTSTADKHEIIQSKYWAQRQRFFSLWDHGVQMDHTAWYSVTPEALSRHHALRCTRAVPWESTNPEKRSTLTILDACCGVGGNTIQFAAKGFNVIAFDNRIDTLELVSCMTGML